MEKVLHMIGNAHIDPVWLWRWQDGFSEIRATFRSALERMKEYPDFIFTCGAAAYYEWVERNDPAMFEEIRERVAQGRWSVVGGWWIQADCNLPCGESLARQALIGQRYFEEKLGVKARTGYNVDSFGHTGSLPKILRMSGMQNYVYMRPGVHEKSYPAWTFTWQSPEGTGVTAYRIPFEYCTWGKELTNTVARCAQEVRDANGMMCFYGVGNHGGGPTKENLDSIAALDGQDGVRLRLSSPDIFFDGLKERELPVVNGDLLHHASGCYSAHSGVKRWNRMAENRLLTAEKWSAAAHLLLGKPYPLADYDRAWKKVLFNQFHDILAGSCIREAYEDVREDYGFALSLAGDHLNDAQQALAGRMRIPFAQDDRPYVAFNPHGFAAHWPVSLEVPAARAPMRLVDSQGREVPYQLSPGSAAAMGRMRLGFVAQVPPLGWEVYRLVPSEDAAPCEADDSLVLENDLVRVEFGEKTGLESLLLKRSGTQMLLRPFEALVIDDPSDTWSHGVLRFDQVEGAMELCEVKVLETGPALRTLRAVYAWNESTLVLDHTLYNGLPYLFLHARLDWRETQKVLKFHFPLAHNYSHVRAQAPYGFADRLMDGEEYPMQQWVDLTGVVPGEGQTLTGLAVLNDGKSSYSAQGRDLYVTVARSPYYANHMPFQVEPGMDYPVVDRGEQRFTLALLPHEGAPATGGVEEAAMLLNAPVTLLPESFHDGDLEARGSVLKLDARHAVLDAVKLSQDGQGALVVHMHETAREEEDAALRLLTLGRDIALHFAPGEIRALRIDLQSGEAVDVDLIETPLSHNNA